MATAIHGGHEVRPEVADLICLDDAGRRREEDPYTGDWTSIADTRGVVHRSRFEVDLNRPREQAVYLQPGDCWELDVWHREPPEKLVEESRALHDRFYRELYELLEEKRRHWGRFIVLDLHSYNYQRDGKPGEPAENPDINLGTESVDRVVWGRLIDRLAADLGAFEVHGRRLEVGENVKFKGAHLVRWVNATFPDSCAVAIEVKKIFMDEAAGTLDEAAWKEVHRALEAAAAGCLDEIGV